MAARDGSIKIFDATNGQEVLTVPGFPVSEDGISSFVYSADGRTMLLASYKTVKAYDIANRRQLRSFPIKEGGCFSPDGRRYFVVTENSQRQGSITIYDTDTGRELRTLPGHNRHITAFVCSSDGQRFVSIDFNGTMKIWDTGTGRELRSVELSGSNMRDVHYSADNRRIVYIDSYRKIIVLDAGNYRELLTIAPLPRITQTNYTVNEKRVIIQTDNAISLWDTETGRRLWSIPVQRSTIISFSPDMRFFAREEPSTNTNQGAVNIGVYDTTTGRQLRVWQNRRNVLPLDIVWNPNNRELILIYNLVGTTSSQGRLLDIWNAENGQLISNFEHRPRLLTGKEPENMPIAIPTSPDNSKIAYRLDDSLQIYETRGTRKLLTINGSFSRALWSPDGRIILTTSNDGTVKIWDAQSGREIPSAARHENLQAITYSPNSRQFVTGSRGNDVVMAWNAENGAKLWESKVNNPVERVDYSADGTKVIAVTSPSLYTTSVYILNSANGEIIFSRSDERSASCSPDGKWILTASNDGSVRVWSAETSIEKVRIVSYEDGEWLAVTPDGFYTASAKGDQYLNARVGNTVSGIDRYRSTFNKPAVVQARLSNSGRMANHRNTVVSVAVNPGGTRIASVSYDGSIKIWDLESGREIRTITGIGGRANTISWSPDGKTLIHGAEDKTIRIWNAETGASTRTISGHDDYVNEARYSPDGKRIASAADDKLIKIWDAETGREIRTLSGHTDLVCVVAWSPDGKRLASGSDKTEKAVRIWDAESGRVLHTLTGQGGRIRGLAYSPDGTKIASCTQEEAMVKIWDANSGRLIRSIPIENRKPLSLAWSSDGKNLAVGYFSDNSGYVGIFDVDTGTRMRLIAIGGTPHSVTWTPDGRRIVTTINFTDAQIIRVYDALGGQEL